MRYTDCLRLGMTRKSLCPSGEDDTAPKDISMEHLSIAMSVGDRAYFGMTEDSYSINFALRSPPETAGADREKDSGTRPPGMLYVT